MKKRSGRNLIRFFYHLLVVLVMAMPMLSGLVRVIYVQANQNAFESYSGSTYKELVPTYYDTNTPTSNNEIYLNYAYYWTDNASFNGFDNVAMYLDHIFVNQIENEPIENVSRIDLFIYSNNNGVYIIIRHLDDTAPTWIGINSKSYFIVPTTIFTQYLPNNFYEHIIGGQLLKEYVEVTQTETLDNAFDYSIWKTMQDFTFHSDFRFTDIANGMLMTFDNNNLYIQYINFYINWVLTCAVISFAPYVLLTFYHLAIGLLDKFMRKGEDL